MPTGIHEPNKPENYYAWKADHRIHLSTGALIVNEQGLILCVYLERTDAHYFLPTKTHQPNISLEQTLAEISKKVGWTFELQTLLGVTSGEFPIPEGGNVTKNVIWYRCKPISQIARDPEDRDADSEIQWKTRAELNEIFASQAHISSDVDQRNVLQMLGEV